MYGGSLHVHVRLRFQEMEFDEVLHPRTLEEAEQMLEDAIEALEYEKIEFLKKEIESLKNFNDIVDTSNNVSNYYHTKNALNDSCHKHIKFSEEQLNRAIANSKNFFKQQLREIKQKQKEEILQIFDEWTEERNNLSEKIEEDFDQTIQTSKILARSNKIKEAIQIRDQALLDKDVSSAELYEKLDEKYEKLCTALQNSHKFELQTLVEKQKEEEAQFEMMKETSQADAYQDYLLSHAQTVVGITEKNSPTKPTPFALIMQTVNASNPSFNISMKESTPNFVSLEDIQ